MKTGAELVRLFGFNATSWLGTIMSFAFAKDVLQLLCMVGSLAVSAASIWWIKKQATALDKKPQ